MELITGVRRNMKGELICLSDRLLLRKRFLIETINDQLKNSSQIEHSRHRGRNVRLSLPPKGGRPVLVHPAPCEKDRPTSNSKFGLRQS